MRFNSPERLQEWKNERAYPYIHDRMFNAVIDLARGSRFLDLGCSYGLLAERLLDFYSSPEVKVWGVDGDRLAIDAGREAGIRATLVHMAIDRLNIAALRPLILQNGITVVVARRVLPELFGHDLELGRGFALLLAEAGVQEVFVEGRVTVKNAVNPLSSINQEVALLSVPFAVRRQMGAVAYMTKRTNEQLQRIQPGAEEPGAAVAQ